MPLGGRQELEGRSTLVIFRVVSHLNGRMRYFTTVLLIDYDFERLVDPAILGSERTH